MTTIDQRIVYGFACTWWDGIEKVGHLPGGLPCCPKCHGVLLELPSPKEWWKCVEAYQAEDHPGYRAFIEWLKGKCYRDRYAAKAAYEAKSGRKAGF